MNENNQNNPNNPNNPKKLTKIESEKIDQIIFENLIYHNSVTKQLPTAKDYTMYQCIYSPYLNEFQNKIRLPGSTIGHFISTLSTLQCTNVINIDDTLALIDRFGAFIKNLAPFLPKNKSKITSPDQTNRPTASPDENNITISNIDLFRILNEFFYGYIYTFLFYEQYSTKSSTKTSKLPQIISPHPHHISSNHSLSLLSTHSIENAPIGVSSAHLSIFSHLNSENMFLRGALTLSPLFPTQLIQSIALTNKANADGKAVIAAGKKLKLQQDAREYFKKYGYHSTDPNRASTYITMGSTVSSTNDDSNIYDRMMENAFLGGELTKVILENKMDDSIVEDLLTVDLPEASNEHGKIIGDGGKKLVVKNLRGDDEDDGIGDQDRGFSPRSKTQFSPSNRGDDDDDDDDDDNNNNNNIDRSISRNNDGYNQELGFYEDNQDDDVDFSRSSPFEQNTQNVHKNASKSSGVLPNLQNNQNSRLFGSKVLLRQGNLQHQFSSSLLKGVPPGSGKSNNKIDSFDGLDNLGQNKNQNNQNKNQNNQTNINIDDIPISTDFDEFADMQDLRDELGDAKIHYRHEFTNTSNNTKTNTRNMTKNDQSKQIQQFNAQNFLDSSASDSDNDTITPIQAKIQPNSTKSNKKKSVTIQDEPIIYQDEPLIQSASDDIVIPGGDDQKDLIKPSTQSTPTQPKSTPQTTPSTSTSTPALTSPTLTDSTTNNVVEPIVFTPTTSFLPNYLSQPPAVIHFTDTKLAESKARQLNCNFSYPAVVITPIHRYAGVLTLSEQKLQFFGRYIPDSNLSNLIAMHKVYSHYTTHPLYNNPFFANDQFKDETFEFSIRTIDIISIITKQFMTRSNAIEVSVNNGSSYFIHFSHPDNSDMSIWENCHIQQDASYLVYKRDQFVLSGQEVPYSLSENLPQNFDAIRVKRRSMEITIQIRVFAWLCKESPTIFNFLTQKQYHDIYDKLTNLTEHLSDPFVSTLPQHYTRTRFARAQKDWIDGKMSNFDYLLFLNQYSGRTFNDLSQYPIFPWILTDYTSPTIDLNDFNIYRDLSKPVGALNEDRFDLFSERYAIAKTENDKYNSFLYGSHYLPYGVVLIYLLRTFPYSIANALMQGGKFDLSDRLLKSIPQTFKDSMTSLTDVKEVIPEFYSSVHWLRNQSGLNLGIPANYIDKFDSIVPSKTQKKDLHEQEIVNIHKISTNSPLYPLFSPDQSDTNVLLGTAHTPSQSQSQPQSQPPPQQQLHNFGLIDRVGDIALPPWASTPTQFITTLRAALEHPYVTSRLHLWIDLIFGYLQANVEAANLFPYMCYQSNRRGQISLIDNLPQSGLRKAAEDQTLYFGICPTLLFIRPHPRREVSFTKLILSNGNITNWLSYWKGITVSDLNHTGMVAGNGIKRVKCWKNHPEYSIKMKQEKFDPKNTPQHSQHLQHPQHSSNLISFEQKKSSSIQDDFDHDDNLDPVHRIYATLQGDNDDVIQKSLSSLMLNSIAQNPTQSNLSSLSSQNPLTIHHTHQRGHSTSIPNGSASPVLSNISFSQNGFVFGPNSNMNPFNMTITQSQLFYLLSNYIPLKNLYESNQSPHLGGISQKIESQSQQHGKLHTNSCTIANINNIYATFADMYEITQQDQVTLRSHLGDELDDKLTSLSHSLTNTDNSRQNSFSKNNPKNNTNHIRVTTDPLALNLQNYSFQTLLHFPNYTVQSQGLPSHLTPQSPNMSPKQVGGVFNHNNDKFCSITQRPHTYKISSTSLALNHVYTYQYQCTDCAELFTEGVYIGNIVANHIFAPNLLFSSSIVQNVNNSPDSNSNRLNCQLYTRSVTNAGGGNSTEFGLSGNAAQNPNRDGGKDGALPHNALKSHPTQLLHLQQRHSPVFGGGSANGGNNFGVPYWSVVHHPLQPTQNVKDYQKITILDELSETHETKSSQKSNQTLTQFTHTGCPLTPQMLKNKARRYQQLYVEDLLSSDYIRSIVPEFLKSFAMINNQEIIMINQLYRYLHQFNPTGGSSYSGMSFSNKGGEYYDDKNQFKNKNVNINMNTSSGLMLLLLGNGQFVPKIPAFFTKQQQLLDLDDVSSSPTQNDSHPSQQNQQQQQQNQLQQQQQNQLQPTLQPPFMTFYRFVGVHPCFNQNINPNLITTTSTVPGSKPGTTTTAPQSTPVNTLTITPTVHVNIDPQMRHSIGLLDNLSLLNQSTSLSTITKQNNHPLAKRHYENTLVNVIRYYYHLAAVKKQNENFVKKNEQNNNQIMDSKSAQIIAQNIPSNINFGGAKNVINNDSNTTMCFKISPKMNFSEWKSLQQFLSSQPLFSNLTKLQHLSTRLNHAHYNNIFNSPAMLDQLSVVLPRILNEKGDFLGIDNILHGNSTPSPYSLPNPSISSQIQTPYSLFSQPLLFTTTSNGIYLCILGANKRQIYIFSIHFGTKKCFLRQILNVTTIPHPHIITNLSISSHDLFLTIVGSNGVIARFSIVYDSYITDYNFTQLPQFENNPFYSTQYPSTIQNYTIQQHDQSAKLVEVYTKIFSHSLLLHPTPLFLFQSHRDIIYNAHHTYINSTVLITGQFTGNTSKVSNYVYDVYANLLDNNNTQNESITESNSLKKIAFELNQHSIFANIFSQIEKETFGTVTHGQVLYVNRSYNDYARALKADVHNFITWSGSIDNTNNDNENKQISQTNSFKKRFFSQKDLSKYDSQNSQNSQHSHSSENTKTDELIENVPYHCNLCDSRFNPTPSLQLSSNQGSTSTFETDPTILKITISPYQTDRPQQCNILLPHHTYNTLSFDLPADVNVTGLKLTKSGTIVITGQKVVTITVYDLYYKRVFHRITHNVVLLYSDHGLLINTFIIPDQITCLMTSSHHYSNTMGHIYVGTISGCILTFTDTTLSPLFTMLTYGPPPHIVSFPLYLQSLHHLDQQYQQCCCAPLLYFRDLTTLPQPVRSFGVQHINVSSAPWQSLSTTASALRSALNMASNDSTKGLGGAPLGNAQNNTVYGNAIKGIQMDHGLDKYLTTIHGAPYITHNRLYSSIMNIVRRYKCVDEISFKCDSIEMDKKGYKPTIIGPNTSDNLNSYINHCGRSIAKQLGIFYLVSLTTSSIKSDNSSPQKTPNQTKSTPRQPNYINFDNDDNIDINNELYKYGNGENNNNDKNKFLLSPQYFPVSSNGYSAAVAHSRETTKSSLLSPLSTMNVNMFDNNNGQGQSSQHQKQPSPLQRRFDFAIEQNSGSTTTNGVPNTPSSTMASQSNIISVSSSRLAEISELSQDNQHSEPILSPHFQTTTTSSHINTTPSPLTSGEPTQQSTPSTISYETTISGHKMQLFQYNTYNAQNILSNLPIPPSLFITVNGERAIDPYYQSYITLLYHQYCCDRNDATADTKRNEQNSTINSVNTHRMCNIYVPTTQYSNVIAKHAVDFTFWFMLHHGYQISDYSTSPYYHPSTTTPLKTDLEGLLPIKFPSAINQPLCNPTNQPTTPSVPSPQKSKDKNLPPPPPPPTRGSISAANSSLFANMSPEEKLQTQLLGLAPPKPVTLLGELFTENISTLACFHTIASKMIENNRNYGNFANRVGDKEIGSNSLDGNTNNKGLHLNSLQSLHSLDNFNNNLLSTTLQSLQSSSDHSYYYISKHHLKEKTISQNYPPSTPPASSPTLSSNITGSNIQQEQESDLFLLKHAQISTRLLLFPLTNIYSHHITPSIKDSGYGDHSNALAAIVANAPSDVERQRLTQEFQDRKLTDAYFDSVSDVQASLMSTTPSTVIYNEMVTQHYYSRLLQGWSGHLLQLDTNRKKVEQTIMEQYNAHKMAQAQASLDEIGTPRYNPERRGSVSGNNQSQTPNNNPTSNTNQNANKTSGVFGWFRRG
jgi:hypothetical protein